MYDVLIIGCGVVGASIAYELSKHDISIAVVEKENDVATGTSKANSAILHSGYDPKPGTLIAKLNVESVPLTKEVCRKLDVLCKNIGSLTVAFSDDDMDTLRKLYDRGIQNGVPDLEMIDANKLFKMEPHINPKAVGALWAPSAAIISPWELCLAMAQTAVKNGTELFLNSNVDSITKHTSHTSEGGFIVKSGNKTIEAKNVINAAGIHSDTIHNLIAKPTFTIKPHSGQYYLFDKSEGHKANCIIFQTPKPDTKGVLVAPTVHGNLLAGPDNIPVKKGDLSVTSERLQYIMEKSRLSIPDINFSENIRNFAGLRAISDSNDFIINETEVKGFFDVAGIKSPGLSAAVAIGKYVKNLLTASGLPMEKKKKYVDSRSIMRFKELSEEEKRMAVEKNPLYGQVICRCETITEGEIIDCINDTIPPSSIDGVKRRVGTGAGRCQGGFCEPRILQILSDQLGQSPLDIQKDLSGSNILVSKTKE